MFGWTSLPRELLSSTWWMTSFATDTSIFSKMRLSSRSVWHLLSTSFYITCCAVRDACVQGRPLVLSVPKICTRSSLSACLSFSTSHMQDFGVRYTKTKKSAERNVQVVSEPSVQKARACGVLAAPAGFMTVPCCWSTGQGLCSIGGVSVVSAALTAIVRYCATWSSLISTVHWRWGQTVAVVAIWIFSNF